MNYSLWSQWGPFIVKPIEQTGIHYQLFNVCECWTIRAEYARKSSDFKCRKARFDVKVRSNISQWDNHEGKAVRQTRSCTVTSSEGWSFTLSPDPPAQRTDSVFSHRAAPLWGRQRGPVDLFMSHFGPESHPSAAVDYTSNCHLWSRKRSQCLLMQQQPKPPLLQHMSSWVNSCQPELFHTIMLTIRVLIC